MLTLCKDWLSVTDGAIAIDLVSQPKTKRLRDKVASQLIAASLDLLVRTWPRGVQLPLMMESVSQFIWRISDIHYIYLRANDDNTLAACIRLSQAGIVTVIVLRHHERLKRQLLTAVLRGRTPCIWPIDSFISYRTLFATTDQAWPRKRALLELLKAYNQRLSTHRGDDALLVQIPQGFSGM